MTLYQPPPGQTSIDPHVEIYGTPHVEINNRIHAASGKRVHGQNMVLQSPKVQCVQGSCASNTTVLSGDIHSLPSTL